ACLRELGDRGVGHRLRAVDHPLRHASFRRWQRWQQRTDADDCAERRCACGVGPQPGFGPDLPHGGKFLTKTVRCQRLMLYRHCVCSESTGPYVVGIDAGGTRTRAAIVTLDGTVAGYGVGPGANPNSGGGSAGELTAALTTALTAAIKDLEPALVVGGVFGIAGAGAANRPRAVASANAAWATAGIPGEPEVTTDIPVAFAAGSTEPVGIVVFAGTGAGAAVINAGEVERRADANGYLLGDEGSAVWIGRAAVRAVMRAYDGRGRATVLAETVPRALLGEAAEPLLAELDPEV